MTSLVSGRDVTDDVTGQQVVVDKHVPHQAGHAGQQQRREELEMDLDAQLTTQVSAAKRTANEKVKLHYITVRSKA